MRDLTTVEKLHQLMEALGHRATGPGRVYLVGGATAVLQGWRATTKDVDLKLDPEPPGVFEAIRDLKDELSINIELASPDDFIPPVPGWESRSLFIASHGQLEFFHYDPVGQALAKIERGHTQDLIDVREMARRGLVDAPSIESAFDQIEPALIRYPALDADAFRQKVNEALTNMKNDRQHSTE